MPLRAELSHNCRSANLLSEVQSDERTADGTLFTRVTENRWSIDGSKLIVIDCTQACGLLQCRFRTDVCFFHTSISICKYIYNCINMYYKMYVHVSTGKIRDTHTHSFCFSSSHEAYPYRKCHKRCQDPHRYRRNVHTHTHAYI